MTQRIVLRAAVRDMDRIIDYLETEAGPAVALKYVGLFDHQLTLLSEFPGIGSPRPALGEFTRITVVSPYIMIYDYREMQDVVVVLRVIHGRRNITRKLLPSGRNDLSQ